MSIRTQTLDPILLKQRMEARIGGDIASGRVGCAAVRVCQNGEVLYENRFGTQAPDTQEPLRGDALFRIASMTKPITAVAILQLAETGKLCLNDPVSKFIPAFQKLPIVEETNGKLTVTKTESTPLTVLHLLTHTAGLGGGAIGAKQLAAMKPTQKASLWESVEYYAAMGLREQIAAGFYNLNEDLYEFPVWFDEKKDKKDVKKTVKAQ